MKRNLTLIGSGLLIVLLTVFIKDFVKEWIAIPLLRLIRMIENFPQYHLWFLFIGLIIFFAYRNLIRWRISWAENRYSRKYSREYLDDLTNLVRNSHRSDFFRERLVQYLAELTIETLAYRERLTPREIKEHLYSGTLSLPREIFDFLLAALETKNLALMKREKGEKLIDRYPSLQLNPLHVVEYLEKQLRPNVIESEDYHEYKDQ